MQATGNPRIDLLRLEWRGQFAPEVAAFKQRSGDFILINTHFSLVNNFVPALNLIERNAQGQPQARRTGLGMGARLLWRVHLNIQDPEAASPLKRSRGMATSSPHLGINRQGVKL